jgi:hypothetical protein
MTPRVCLVTPAHPASNPRLLKEADALHAAGFSVHVVCGRYFPPLDPFDAPIFARAAWSREVVCYSRGPRALLGNILRRLARRRLAAGAAPSLALSLRAHHAAIPALAAAAVRARADLYIGHTLAGLAAAGLAAERARARLGFDAEDFHPAETREAENDPVERATIHRIESAYLPRCRHLGAASPLIGRAYAEAYGIQTPVTVLNVFPLSEAPAAPVAPERPGGLPLLYWFSQTIGPGRGLEPLVVALGRLRHPCALRLRGLPAPGFPDALRSLARETGFTGPVEFAPVGPPAEMARLAAGSDLGLSLEQRAPRNRDLCLTNKIFTYLLAGVPVALSPTAAQLALAPELGAAALPLPVDDPGSAAPALDAFLGDPDRLAAARAAAWRLGHERFNWDLGRATLLDSVRSALRP